MAARKTLLVAGREFHENVRTKGFWLGIFVLPAILVVAFMVPLVLQKLRSARPYAVVDHSGWLADAVQARAAREDLGRVLTFAVEQRERDSKRAERLPAVVVEAAELVERLATPATLGVAMPADSAAAAAVRTALRAAAASALASAAVDASAPERAAVEERLRGRAQDASEIERTAEALRDWWSSVTPGEARSFGGRASRGRFALQPVAESAAGQELNLAIARGDLFAYFVIPADPLADDAAARYVSHNVTDEGLREWFTRLASEEIRERRLRVEQIDDGVAAAIQRQIPVSLTRLDDEGNEAPVLEADLLRAWAPAAFTYALWMAVFAISQGLLISTIEEKSTRVIEVLLSSLSARQLMAGKILGAMSTGLTTVAVWALCVVLAALFLPDLLDRMFGVGQTNIDLSAIVSEPRYLASFIVYFLLGYMLYATLLVGIGSLCNTVQESQNLIAPVMMLMIVPMLAALSLPQDPNGTLGRALSYFPPFTPFVMMGRAAGPPSLVEYVVTTILLVLTIAGVFVIATRVFQAGILMNDKRPPLREVLRIARTGAVAARPALES